MSPEEPDILIAARNESPLIIGIGVRERFLASDVPAVITEITEVVYLENEEIAVLEKDKEKYFNLQGKSIRKKRNEIKGDVGQASKKGYKHFMLKEIFEQPRVIIDTIDGLIGDKRAVLEGEIWLKKKEIKDIKRIIIVACGTSWHAGLVGEFMFEELAKIPVEVEYASEFRYRNPIVDKNTLVIAISQSGETADTLAAIREARRKKAKILSIVNVRESSITRESNFTLYTKAGPEIGVASTKAFMAQLIVLYLLTVYFGDIRGVISKKQVNNRIRDLRLLPNQIRCILRKKDYIKRHAKMLRKKKNANALYLGRGINYPIALEGALKLKEVSYIHAEGYPAAEMKHGPIALIDKKMPVVVIATRDNRTYKKILGNIREISARGGVVIAITTIGDNEMIRAIKKRYVRHTLPVPPNSYILTPLLAVVPLQLFAYYIADFRNLDPDKPKNLAKSVTVE
jgi:glucosamine--fructose-6-phosphate aminotransferase (isomerizing)